MERSHKRAWNSGLCCKGRLLGWGWASDPLHNSVQQPRKSGSLVEMGRVWMVGAQGLRKGRPLSLPGIWPFEPSLHRFPPGSGGGEGRQKLRCGVGVADALRGFSQPEGSPPCPLPPPATLSPRLGSGRGSSRGALGQGWEGWGRLGASSGGAAPPPAPPPPRSPLREAARLARRPLALRRSHCLPAPRSAAAPPPTPPPASSGDRAARAGLGQLRAGGGSWPPPCGPSSGSSCWCSGRLPGL